MAENNHRNASDARKRLFWFAGIWLAGVVALAAFAYGARALMGL
ncbi:hypothetical protein FHS78_002130 [Parvibaculum indicum]|nr:DUF2474 family protein [Parvibaculum indicum]NIJ41840.1 hypothetical protein [Parvibaculum indicum]